MNDGDAREGRDLFKGAEDDDAAARWGEWCSDIVLSVLLADPPGEEG